MAQADWGTLTGGLDVSNIDRGVTNGIARPNGGGNFLFGFNTLSTTIGAAGLYCVITNFDPIQPAASAGGGRISAAIQRGAAGGSSGFSPFLFIGASGNSVSDTGYLLGLEDTEPHSIVLRKGVISEGIPSAAIGTQGILLKSNQTYSQGTWVHVRLDMIVNLNGDVILQCFENDLTSNAVTAAVWTAIPGATEFIDDALGVNSGSAPLVTGRVGFAFRNAGQIARRAFFDHIEISRQLP